MDEEIFVGVDVGMRDDCTAIAIVPAWIVDTGNTRGGTRTEGRWRPTTAPAPTITSRADQLEWRDHRPQANG